MTILRSFLVGIFGLMLVYTVAAIVRDGAGLFAIYFGDVFAVGWRGQFNLDFAGYLILSALWLLWRSGGSRAGIVQAAVSGVLGMTVFAPLVIALSVQAKGDLRKLVLGVHA